MRKVRLYINVTLDGYVAGPNGELDWVFRTMTPAQQAWTTAFLGEVDTILIGHDTYLEQAAFWPTQSGEMAALMNSHTKIVFSRRLSSLGWNNSHRASADVSQVIADLKEREGKGIYVTGGARLAQSLSCLLLIDEYDLIIHPVLLGSGMPLFASEGKPLDLKLERTKVFETGAVLHMYQRV